MNKIDRYKRYIKDSNELETEKFLWNADFMLDSDFKFSPLSDELETRIIFSERYAKIDAIDVLEKVIRGNYNNVIIEAYTEPFSNYKNMTLSDILINPKNYPSELVKDLDEVLNEMYNHNPYFRYDW